MNVITLSPVKNEERGKTVTPLCKHISPKVTDNKQCSVLVLKPNEQNARLMERIEALRYKIYVEEMELPYDRYSEAIKDKFDHASYQLLFVVDGKDVGCMRLTPKQGNMLELEEQSLLWKNIIHHCNYPVDTICEVNRFMIRKQWRGTFVSPLFFYELFKLCIQENILHLFLAGKVGRLGKMYRRFGCDVYDDNTQPYVFEGVVLGHYNLLHYYLGGKYSFKRNASILLYKMLYFLLMLAPKWFNRYYSRGKGFRKSKTKVRRAAA